MKLLKTTFIVIVGSLVLARVAVPVQAQNAQADAAAFAEFKKTCSPQIAKMKATLVSVGEPISDAEFDGFFQKLPAEMREGAKFQERRVDTAFYREMAANVKAEAAKPNNPDKGGVLMAPVLLCFIDVLIVRETGGASRPTSPAASTPGSSPTRPGATPGTGTRPAATPATPAKSSADPNEPPSSSNPFGCVVVEKKGGPYVNVCPFPVYFTACGTEIDEGSWTSDCNQQKTFGLDGIAAKGTQGGFTRAGKIYTFACEKPQTPRDVEFIPGKGLYGSCK